MPNYRVTYSVQVKAKDEEMAKIQAHMDYADGCGTVEVEEVEEADVQRD